MTQRSIRRMGPGGKLLLTAIGVALLAAPIAFGLAHLPQRIATAGNAGQEARVLRSQIQNTALQARSPIAGPAPSATVAAPATRTTSAPRSPQPPATLPLVVPGPTLPQTAAQTPDREVHCGPGRPTANPGVAPTGTYHDCRRTTGWQDRGSPAKRPPGCRADAHAASRQDPKRSEFVVSNPQVSVIVVAAKNPHVTIQGSVQRPGLYLLGRPTTVMELIAQAGGLSVFAQGQKVSIIRQEGGAASYHTFDYSTFRTGSWQQNLTLKAGDIVVVP